MIKLTSMLVLLAAAGFAPMAFADPASVTILSPFNGSKLDPKVRTRLYYEFATGPKGDHAHLYLDKKQVAELRRIKDSYTMSSMALGPHEICIKLVNKAHKPVGAERCIEVSVEKQVVKFEEAPTLIHGH